MAEERRLALRELLRGARGRISPAEFGISVQTGRRAHGLLSDEVAELIGVSKTWYGRFEGGGARMSIGALNRLADVLRLDARERSRLATLAIPEYENFVSAERVPQA